MHSTSGLEHLQTEWEAKQAPKNRAWWDPRTAPSAFLRRVHNAPSRWGRRFLSVWSAKENQLCPPLPEGWQEFVDPASGATYYTDPKGFSTWVRPLLPPTAAMPAPPPTTDDQQIPAVAAVSAVAAAPQPTAAGSRQKFSEKLTDDFERMSASDYLRTQMGIDSTPQAQGAVSRAPVARTPAAAAAPTPTQQDGKSEEKKKKDPRLSASEYLRTQMGIEPEPAAPTLDSSEKKDNRLTASEYLRTQMGIEPPAPLSKTQRDRRYSSNAADTYERYAAARAARAEPPRKPHPIVAPAARSLANFAAEQRERKASGQIPPQTLAAIEEIRTANKAAQERLSELRDQANQRERSTTPKMSHQEWIARSQADKEMRKEEWRRR